MTKAEPLRHVSILWAEPGHAGELSRLHAALFDAPWTASSFRELLADPGSIAFVARVGQQLETAGFIVGRVAADEAEILTLGVCAPWQRRGIGRKLVEAFCRAAKKAEAQQAYLEVAAGNDAAIALYRQLGFQEIGRRKGYYHSAGAGSEDAINLALAL
jgi:ribosomal-protein-alanine N-acetyltransferase